MTAKYLSRSYFGHQNHVNDHTIDGLRCLSNLRHPDLAKIPIFIKIFSFTTQIMTKELFGATVATA